MFLCPINKWRLTVARYQGRSRIHARQLASEIRAVAFDFDGVFTDNTESHDIGSTCAAKRRSHYDGQGISLLRAVGIRVAIITGENGAGAGLATQLVTRWNRLPSTKTPENPDGWEEIELHLGCRDMKKAEVLGAWLERINVSPLHCAVMGDDLVDVHMLRMAGLRASPITGEEVIKDICHFVSERRAQFGAVRDLVNFIFEAQRLNPLDYATS